MMGVALYVASRRGEENAGAWRASRVLVLFGRQLALNALWSWAFFGRRSPGWAHVEIVLLEKGMRSYGALRLWSTSLIGVGIVGVVFVIIGTITAMFQAYAFGQALAIVLIGGPLAALFARASGRWSICFATRRATAATGNNERRETQNDGT
jgi:hypothetical protein